VFKGSAKPTGNIFRELQLGDGYTEECLYACNEKAWFNETIMLQWIEKVWKPTVQAKNGRLTYLLLDECPVHMTANVIRAFNELITELELIPGGYTAKLQVLDVGINKSFKSNCRRQFERWLEVHADGSKPHRQNASMWAAEAWNQITTTTIKNTWNHIGYFNMPIDDNNNDNNAEEINNSDMEVLEDIAGDDINNNNVIGGTESDNSGSDDDDFIDEPAIYIPPKKRSTSIIENIDDANIDNNNGTTNMKIDEDTTTEDDEEFDEDNRPRSNSIGY
jgi:DDE superfamily endonuclease